MAAVDPELDTDAEDEEETREANVGASVFVFDIDEMLDEAVIIILLLLLLCPSSSQADC